MLKKIARLSIKLDKLGFTDLSKSLDFHLFLEAAISTQLDPLGSNRTLKELGIPDFLTISKHRLNNLLEEAEVSFLEFFNNIFVKLRDIRQEAINTNQKSKIISLIMPSINKANQTKKQIMSFLNSPDFKTNLLSAIFKVISAKFPTVSKDKNGFHIHVPSSGKGSKVILQSFSPMEKEKARKFYLTKINRAMAEVSKSIITSLHPLFENIYEAINELIETLERPNFNDFASSLGYDRVSQESEQDKLKMMNNITKSIFSGKFQTVEAIMANMTLKKYSLDKSIKFRLHKFAKYLEQQNHSELANCLDSVLF